MRDINHLSIVDFDPARGQAYQGDVAIVPVPPALAGRLNRSVEVSPVSGRLILQEGEVTGHHHGIDVLDRPMAEASPRRSMAAGKLMADALAGSIPVPSARLYRDPALAEAMVRDGPLARADLCVGFLVVEHGPMVVSHQEHAGIRLPEGVYYIGRQVESVGAEERRVAD